MDTEEIRGERPVKWSEAETLFFLETMLKHRVRTRTRNEPEFFWKQVVSEMNNNDTKRVFTYAQCQRKYSGMKRTFRDLIESNRESNSRWPYFGLIEELISGDNDGYGDDVTLNIDQMLQESDATASREEYKVDEKFHWPIKATTILLHELKKQGYAVGIRCFQWSEIVDKLRILGYRVSIAQCNSKLSSLKRTYNNMLTCIGEQRREWPFFKLVDELFNDEQNLNSKPNENDRTVYAENCEDLNDWNENGLNILKEFLEDQQWTDDDVAILLNVMIQEWESPSGDSPFWHRITDTMNRNQDESTNRIYSVQQCCDVYKNLKQTFEQMQQSGKCRKWRFYDIMVLVNSQEEKYFASKNEGEICVDNEMNWSTEAVHALVNELKSNDAIMEFRRNCLWQNVSGQLANEPYKSTPTQCINKLYGLKRNHDAIEGTSLDIKREWPYCEVTNNLITSGKSFWIPLSKNTVGSKIDDEKSISLTEKTDELEYSNDYSVVKTLFPTNKKTKPLHERRWSRKAVLVLVDAIRCAIKPSGLKLSIQLWKKVSSNLALCGIKQTPINCRTKWSTLITDYHNAKQRKRKWCYNKIMDDLFRSIKDCMEQNSTKQHTSVESNKESLKSGVGLSDGENLLEATFGFDADAWPSGALNEKNEGSICRCCLTLCSEFSQAGNLTRALLQFLSQTKPLMNDVIPCVMCQKCYDQAISLYKFHLRCQRANSMLTNICNQVYKHVDNSNSESDAIVMIVSDAYDMTGNNINGTENASSCNTKKSDESEPIKFSAVSSNSSDKGDIKDSLSFANSPNKDNRTNKILVRTSRRWKANICKKTKNKFLRCSKAGCKKMFLTARNLQYHMRSHGICRYKCGICDEAYLEKHELSLHCQSNHNNVNIQIRCRYCNQILPDFNVVHSHRSLSSWNHNKFEAFVLLMLDITNDNSLKYKLCINEPSSVEEMKVDDINQTQLVCDCCGKVFENAQDCKEHLSVHIQKIACTLCSKREFTMKGQLLMHMEKFHDIQTSVKGVVAINTPLKHQCHECGKLFRTKRTLQVHNSTHIQCLCGICGDTITSGLPFRLHMRRHERPEKLKLFTIVKGKHCEMCNISYHTKEALIRHVSQVHEGFKKFKCKTCSKAFWTPGNLMEHEKRHLGKRPYTCKECGLNLVSARALLLHERAKHTGYKPHQCCHCGESFISANRKNVHIKVKHEAANFACPSCDKVFHLRSILNTHIRKVHQKAKRRGIRHLSLACQVSKEDKEIHDTKVKRRLAKICINQINK